MTETTIKNHKIIFDEETHRYLVDGKQCYSVTQVISHKLDTKYSGIDANILKRASDYGNRVHGEIEDYEMLGAETDSVELSDYKWLKSQYKWEVVDSEVFVLLPYKDIFICGKFDLLATIGGFKYIFDIKTTASLDRASLAMQLTMYKMAYKYSYDVDIDCLAYIWINDKGNNSIRKFGEIQANESFIEKLLEEFYTYLEMGF